MAMSNQTHFRSISLPSRLDQVSPTNLEFECELEKIKNCSPTSKSIQSGLLGLAELYNSVQEFTQKSKVDSKSSSMDDALSQSVDLLDACTAIKELLQMMRESIHSLQSALRRKGTDAAVQNDVASFFSFRRKMQKTVVKTLKNLKKSESSIVKNSTVNSVNSEGELGFVFRQLAAITIANFKGVLDFVSYAAARGGAWLVVSKLMVKESGVEKSKNEVDSMDLGVESLQGKMGSDGGRLWDVQRRLKIVDDVIERFEGGLERLFRQLVKTRVALLNILTDH